MLQRDYILELIENFVNTVVASLRRALGHADPQAAEEAEAAIARLIDLDPGVAMQLAPESLVTMMQLSGIADSVADYAAYTLSLLSHAYDGMGDHTTAAARRAQAQAIADAFGYDFSEIPEGLEGLEA